MIVEIQGIRPERAFALRPPSGHGADIVANNRHRASKCGSPPKSRCFESAMHTDNHYRVASARFRQADCRIAGSKLTAFDAPFTGLRFFRRGWAFLFRAIRLGRSVPLVAVQGCSRCTAIQAARCGLSRGGWFTPPTVGSPCSRPTSVSSGRFAGPAARRRAVRPPRRCRVGRRAATCASQCRHRDGRKSAVASSG